MRIPYFAAPWTLAVVFALVQTDGLRAAVLRVATFNLENYLDTPVRGRNAKSPESKAQVQAVLLRIAPDVIALQEIGSASALLELQASLQQRGLDLPFSQLVSAADTNTHLAVLSRFAFGPTHFHTNESFLLNGRRFHLSRGLAEIDFVLESGFRFTFVAAHLKSKRASPAADEAALRLEEAKLVREAIDARLASDPNLNLIVVGDFNDTKDSDPIKTIIGRGRSKLVDTRPAEATPTSAQDVAPRGAEERLVTWTHYYGAEDSYRRIDFILLNHEMARFWQRERSYVLADPEWGRASDHRPVVALFETPNGAR